MNKRINLEEIEWVPSSTADPVGRVFMWKNKIYRAVREEYVSFYKKLFDDGIFDKLNNTGYLINTAIAPFSLDGYGLILQHEKITFPSYPFEWCGEMFRDAAILMCDFTHELFEYDLEIKDIHSYHIFFESNQPKFIDIGSIIKRTQKSKWFLAKDFFYWMIFPLHCISRGKSEEVRDILRYELEGLDVRKKMTSLLPLWFKYSVMLTHNLTFLSSPPKILDSFKEEIINTKLIPSQTEWAGYARDGKDYFLPFDNQNKWFTKQKNVYKLLKKLKPTTVLDFGCNIGWYSELAAREGAKVIALDVDEMSLTNLYKRVKKLQLTIQTALVDFVQGTASNITWPSAADRFKSDMVLALALTHHLVFKNHLDFFTIAKELSKYSNKWLLVEFVPPDDRYISHWIKTEHDWYKLDNLVSVLRKYFPKIEIMESTPYPRKLLFCEK